MKKAKDPFFTLFSPVIRNKICGEIINRFIKPCKTIGRWSRSREKINQILGGGRRKKNPRGPPARNGPRDILLLPYHPIRNAGNGGFEKKNGFTWVNTFFPPLATLDKDISRASRMAGRRFARERWQGMARRRKNGTWAAVVKDARHPARNVLETTVEIIYRSRGIEMRLWPTELLFSIAMLTQFGDFYTRVIRRDFIYWMISRIFERRNATIGYELERLGDFE